MRIVWKCTYLLADWDLNVISNMEFRRPTCACAKCSEMEFARTCHMMDDISTIIVAGIVLFTFRISEFVQTKNGILHFPFSLSKFHRNVRIYQMIRYVLFFVCFQPERISNHFQRSKFIEFKL